MTVMDVELAPPVTEVQEGDHDKSSHIVVPASAIMEAMVTGTPCMALCGKMWVPSSDPERFGVCPTCIEVFEQITGRMWAGRR